MRLVHISSFASKKAEQMRHVFDQQIADSLIGNRSHLVCIEEGFFLVFNQTITAWNCWHTSSLQK